MRSSLCDAPLEAQELLDAAPFALDVVNTLKRVFEDAWANVAPTIAADRIADTRLNLAHAIVAHAASGVRNVDALQTSALRVVRWHSGRCTDRT